MDSLIAKEMKRVDSSLSMFNPSSIVSQVNDNRIAYVSDEYFIKVFRLSKEICQASGGMFDPTVRPLVNLWGFGKERPLDFSEPSDSAIAIELAKVGMAECEIADDGCVMKKHPDTSFDFSAIAKGFGVDCVADLLEANGVDDYMVEIGGEIVLKGRNPRGELWAIQIDAPSSGEYGHEALTVERFGPERTAIATSGNYRNFHTADDGKKYGHTISPVSGRPVQTETLSATIINSAGSCATADAFATAVMALPADSALSLLNSRPYLRPILVRDDN